MKISQPLIFQHFLWEEDLLQSLTFLNLNIQVSLCFRATLSDLYSALCCAASFKNDKWIQYAYTCIATHVIFADWCDNFPNIHKSRLLCCNHSICHIGGRTLNQEKEEGIWSAYVLDHSSTLCQAFGFPYSRGLAFLARKPNAWYIWDKIPLIAFSAVRPEARHLHASLTGWCLWIS